MRKRNAVIVCLMVLFSLTAAYAQKPEDIDAAALVREGVSLFDKGDYKAAINKYTLALSADPGNDSALYERAMAFLAAHEYARCMEDVEKGMKKESRLQPAYFVLAGNCCSAQGQNEKALGYYESGLKLFPSDEQLHFNIAVTLSEVGRDKEARDHLKKVLSVDANRGSANLYLALLYQKGGYRIPAIFMYLRFLLVEPSSARSRAAVEQVISLVNQGVREKGKGNINILINPDAPTDEGDFGPLSIGMSISSAAAIARKKDTDKSEADISAESISNIVQIAHELNDANLKKTFVWKQAISTLIAMKKAKVLKPFLYRELGLAGTGGARSWLGRNPKRLDRLAKWTSANISKP